MTTEMINFLTNDNHGRGLIFVQEFDTKTELFLSSNYNEIWKTHNQRLVRDSNDKEFLVIKPLANCRGKKSRHIIIDERIDDEVVDTLILYCLCGITRKVEIF